MATRAEIESTYNYMDRLWRASAGDHADITCAFFDGDFSKSLERAQLDKYDVILGKTQFQPGDRVLDIGCGWGGLLAEVRRRGGRGKGITLSSRQQAACARAGLDVSILDWNDLDFLGSTFDVIASVGAFEHFCSKDTYLLGEQERVYEKFFATCHRLLAAGKRMFLQTMTWGERAPHAQSVSLTAAPGSDEYILAVLEKFYPGSWLPHGLEQIARCAEPWFSIEWQSNGRRDYIETMSRWREKTFRLQINKLIPALELLTHAALSREVRYRIECLRNGYNQECFRRGVMDHYRLVLRRR